MSFNATELDLCENLFLLLLLVKGALDFANVLRWLHVKQNIFTTFYVHGIAAGSRHF